MNEVNQKSLTDQRSWIEYFYREMYIQKGFGPQQNEYYMEEIINRLNDSIKNYLNNSNPTVLDVGCAMGYGTSKISDSFPNAKVSGLEVCEFAVEGAKSRFPNIEFIFENQGKINKKYDVIISSHCLEHYPDPLDMLLDLLVKTNKYCVILAPYMEFPLGKTHSSVITDSILPDKILINDNHYVQLNKDDFDGDKNYSRSRNILVIYECNLMFSNDCKNDGYSLLY